MTRASTQILTGYFSQFWSVAMSIGFIPSFIGFLGIKLYGVIGVFIAIQAVFAIFDTGIANALTREVARFRYLGDWLFVCKTIRTGELVGVSVSALLCLVSLPFFVWLLPNFSAATGLSTGDVWQIYVLGVFLVLCKSLENIYRQSLAGLQKIATINTVSVFSSTFKGLGAYLALKYISPTLQSFFLAQILALLFSAISFFLILKCTFVKVGPKIQIRPSLSLLRAMTRFSISITAIMGLTTVLLQADRLVLPFSLSLEDFGYYSFAATLAGGLFYLISPITSTVFPRLCALYEAKDSVASEKLFGSTTQLITIIIVPIVLLLSFQSKSLIILWSSSQQLANNVAPLFSILLLGNLFCCLSYLPSQLQFSQGITKLWLRILIIEALIYIPLLWIIAPLAGAYGVSIIWLCVNIVIAFIAVPWSLTRINRINVARWFFAEMLSPLTASVFTMVIAFNLFDFGGFFGASNLINRLLYSIFVYSLGCLSGLAVSASLRSIVASRLLALKRLF